MGPEIYFWEFAWQNPLIGLPALLVALSIATLPATAMALGCFLVLDDVSKSFMLACPTFVASSYCIFKYLVVAWGGS